MAKNEVLTKTEHIQNRIQDAHTSSRNNQAKLDELRTERAGLTVTGSKSKKTADVVRDIDRQIKGLTESIANSPAELALLEQNLKDEQERIEQEAKDSLIAEQKKAARKIESLSESLVDFLSDTMKINTELQVVYRQYCQLHEKTGVSVISKNVTRGSKDMLKWVFDYCSKEFSGESVIRPMLQPGCPQV